jgi:N-acetylmuramoyl-L-alanine amidase
MKFDQDGWLDIATEVDYSANSMSREGYSINFLVIHGTAGGTSAQGIGEYFQSTIGGSNPVSSHIIIDQQGNVAQGVPLSLAAFANGVITNGHASFLPDPSINPNYYTASIEFVKASTDNSDALTPIQAQVGFEVIQCICDTYGIPKRAGDVNGGIIKHADIDPVNRSRCPGTFDFNALWAYLANGGNTMGIPANWADDGATLTAPNGHKVTQGFRGWILTHAWDPANVPLEDVESANPVEDYYNQAVNSGTRQMFQYCELAWTSARGVYVVGIGNELLGCRKDRDTAKAQVTSLQSQVASLQDDAVSQENDALKAKIAQAIKDLS